ncbi:MAG: HIT family protein [Nitrosopumilus sp. B06]|nr:MAG: HIT family protein [Nitrosopumilus sp. B06]
MDCIFCGIIDGTRKGHILYDDGSHLAFLDKYPIDTGHTLIVPQRHHQRITDMKDEDVGRIFALVPRIARAVLAATGADAFSLGQNNGKAARQIVPHVHVHIIPRYSRKGAVWTKRSIPTDSELDDIAKKIRSYLE